MSVQTGFVDSDGHPRIRIRVSGINPGVYVDLSALIDTGFTGFLAFPLTRALSLGLVLIGTGDYVLADGSAVTNFLVRGTVQVGSALPRPSAETAGVSGELLFSFEPANERMEGVIVLAGDEPLIGMEFLRTLKKSLVIGSTTVALVDEPFEFF